jgi:hypothetical protein
MARRLRPVPPGVGDGRRLDVPQLHRTSGQLLRIDLEEDPGDRPLGDGAVDGLVTVSSTRTTTPGAR